MLTYFYWWYGEELTYILRASLKTTKKTIWFFSVPLLLKTLLSPWKRDQINIENASIDVRFRILVGNLVSRLVGMVIRIFTIITGLVCYLSVLIICLALIIIWITLPLIIIGLIVIGFRRFINGYV